MHFPTGLQKVYSIKLVNSRITEFTFPELNARELQLYYKEIPVKVF